MPEVCVATVDKNIGHASTCPNPYHRGTYKAELNSKVYIGGNLVIVKGDGMSGCKDIAVGASSKVYIGGIGVHRKGDATSGHDFGGCPGTYPANAAATGSSKVSAG